MAKQKKLKAVDDFGFDNELDIPSFDYPMKSAKDDRKPSTKIAKDFAKGAVSGLWDSTRSESFIRRTVKQALPSGYGTAWDMADQTGRSLKSLYDSSAKEVKPLLNDMKRATGKLLPSVGKVLPRKTQDRIKAWSDSYDNGSSGINIAQQRDATLQAALGDIFSYQAETSAQQRAEDKAESNIHRQIENNRSNMQLGQLNSIGISLQRLADYQDRVTANYQRKSLELQYRQYFVALDALQHQRETAVQNKAVLEEIQKNTGLPDILKIQVSKDFPTLMRNKFFGQMGSMLLGNRSQFMTNLTQSIQNSVMEKVKGFVGGARTGISGLEFGMDLGSMMGDQGPGAGEMVGSMVGGVAGDALGNKYGRKFGNWVNQKAMKSKYGAQIRKGGNVLDYTLGNVPQHAAAFADSDKYNDTPLIGGVIKMLKDSIKQANSTKTGVDRDSLRNLQEPAVFNGMARKSLTEIIPGYLARIYQELQIIRTGDAKTDLTTFDVTSGRFKTRQEAAKSIHAALFKKGDKDRIKRMSDWTLDDIEKKSGHKLTPEMRKAIAETLQEDNLNNKLGSPERLGNISTYFGRKHYDKGGDMAAVFRDYFKDDPEGEKKMRFQQIMNRLGGGMTDNRSDIQGLINTGYGDMIEEMGLLDKSGTSINMDRLQDYYLNGEYNPNAAHASGEVRGFGGPATTPADRFNVKYGSGRGVGKRVKPRQTPASVKNDNRRSSTRHDKRQFHSAVNHHVTNIVNQIAGGVQDGLNVTYGHGRTGTGPVKRRGSTINHPENNLLMKTAVENVGKSHGQLGVDNAQMERLIDEEFKRLGGQHTKGSKTPDAKSLTEQLLEQVVAIRKRLDGEGGLNINNYQISGEDLMGHLKGMAGQGASKLKGLYQMTIGDAVGGAWSGIKKGAAFANSLPGRALGAGKWALGKATPHWNKAAGLFGQGKQKALDFANKFDDIYIPGKDSPALLAWKLRAGYYRDKATGTIIKSYKDIKGDVIDTSDNNNVALLAADIKYAYLSSKMKEKMLTSLGAAAKWGLKTLGNMQAGVFSLIPKVWDMGKRALDIGVHFLDQPMDIYVKGKSDPLLLARMMKSGAYVSKMTGKHINRPGEIDGPVLDISDKNNPKEALTREDLIAGIVDWQGKPIKTPLQKVWGAVTTPFRLIKGAVSDGMNFAKALVTKPIQAIGQFFTNWFSKDGIVFSGSKTMVERLTEIRDVLRERLPKPKNIRRGSWEDLESHASKSAKDKNAGGSAGVDKGIFGKLGSLGSGLSGLLSRFKKKDDADDAKEKKEKSKSWIDKGLDFAKGTAENYLGDKASDWGKKGVEKGAKGAAKKAAERLGKSRLKDGLIHRGLKKLSGTGLEEAAKFGGEAAVEGGAGVAAKSVLKGGVKNVARDAFGRFAKRGAVKVAERGAMAAGEAGIEGAAAGAGEGALAGIGAELGVDGLAASMGIAGGGALGTGLLSSLAAGLGATAAGVGAVLASPVVLGAAALAVAGAGIYASYKGIKHLLAKKPGPLDTVRMAQYGCKAGDEEHIQAMYAFEQSVMKHIVYDKDNKASFDDKKLNADEAFGPFGVDKTNQRDLKNWLSWYQLRFKPVFLSHMTALHGINSKVSLTNVDKSLKKEEKQKYLAAVANPSGPYGYMTSPFHQSGFLFMHWGGGLTASYPEVREAIAAAQKEVGKETDAKKGESKLAKFGTGLAAALTGSTDAKAGEKLDKDGKPIPKTFAEKAGGVLGTALKYATPIGAGLLIGGWLKSLFKPADAKKADAKPTAGKKPTTSVGIDPSLTKMTSSKIDALASVRYRAYGLVDLDEDKVAMLKNLEEYTSQFVKIDASLKNYTANYTGDPEVAVKAMGQAYGVTGVHNNAAYNWIAWYHLRFLPVYLTYVGSLTKTTGKSDTHQGILQSWVAARIAPVIVAAKNSDGHSIWTISQSPWKGYDLNTNPKSVDKLIDFLKDKQAPKKLSDGTGVTAKDSKKSSTGVDKKDDKKDDKKPASTPKGDGGKGWTDLLADKGKDAWDTVKSWGANLLDKGKSLVKSGVSAVGNFASNVYTAAKNSSVGKAITGVAKNAASGVGDSMKGFGATLGKGYKAVVGDAKAIKDALFAALKKAGITNPTEQAMFMAQTDVESGGFKHLSENLNYSASRLGQVFGKYLRKAGKSAEEVAQGGPQAIADLVYGGRLGNSGPDDGWKYRGRGIIQLTGKSNYEQIGKAIGVDLVNNPDLLTDPKVSAAAAVAFWKLHVSSSAAQAGDVRTVTQAINGGQNGAADRASKFQQYMQQAKNGSLIPPGAGGAADTKTASTGSGSSASTGSGVSAPTPSGSGSASPGGSPAGSSPTLASVSGGSPAPSAGPAATGTPAGAPSSGGGGIMQVSSPAKPAGGASKIPNVSVPAMPGSSSVSDMTQNPFGFGSQSAKPMSAASPTRNIQAVQQAQHDDKMQAMGGMGDVLNKSLGVQTEARDTLKAIYAAVQAMQGGKSAPASTSAPVPPPTSASRGQMQPMAPAPVSMSKMV
jgi:predicted chitinase